MREKRIIVAIDGYSSCGKSTVAKALAKKLNFVYIDSGAMYRAVTLYFIRHAIDVGNPQQIEEALQNIQIDFINQGGKTAVMLNKEDVTTAIRSMQVSGYVSEISSIKAIREAMVGLQQQMGERCSLVMDGRDIGTVVFPHAQVKIFMIADPKVRADRRFKELKATDPNITLEEVFENLAHRDFQDTTRKESPLIHAEDAITLDNTNLTEEEQLNVLIGEIAKHCPECVSQGRIPGPSSN